MAHWNPYLLHTPPSPADTDEKFKDLFPPRKRLLAGLKHIDTSEAIAASFPAQPCHAEVCAETTTALSGLPPCSLLLNSPSHRCLSCGDGSEVLHRVPCLAGAISYFCSSCVLLFNKRLYCIECLQIIEREPLTSSSSSSLSPPCLTCCRCQRPTHLTCTLEMWPPCLEGSGLTLCRDCYTRNNGQHRELPAKKQKAAGLCRSKQAAMAACKVKGPELDQQFLVAARIVASMAKNDAFEAKLRATLLAKAAAHAAADAKAALDTVYMLSQKKASTEEHASAVDTGSKVRARVRMDEPGRVTMARTSRGLKKRALSAIVASETLSMGKHRMAAPTKPTEKLLRTSFDADDGGQSMPSPTDKMSHRQLAQKVKLGIKRRRTLSSLTNSHATVPRKGKPSAEKPVGPRLSTKGKLGAMVSHVLALNKAQKHQKAADKGRSVWVQCEGSDGVEVDGYRTLTVS